MAKKSSLSRTEQKAQERYVVAERILLDYLREKGLRMTDERRQILLSVCAYPRYFTAEQLLDDVRKQLYISTATCYNTLSLFVDCRLLRKLDSARESRFAQYELVQGKLSKMRFICSECGREVEFWDNAVEDILRARQFSNFTMDSLTLHVYGKCKLCRRKRRQ